MTKCESCGIIHKRLHLFIRGFGGIVMKVIDLTCTKCGSNLQVSYEEGMTTAYCQYCGQKILLDPEALEVNVHHSGTIRHENIT